MNQRFTFKPLYSEVKTDFSFKSYGLHKGKKIRGKKASAKCGEVLPFLQQKTSTEPPDLSPLEQKEVHFPVGESNPALSLERAISYT
jgi:hypothetical protein